MISALNASIAIVEADGLASRPFQAWLRQLLAALEAATVTASAAAPASAQVVASGGLQGAGGLGGNVGLSLYVAISGAASLPTAGNATGDWAYALDGRKPGEAGGAGTGVPCFWSNGAWIAVTSGAGVTT